MLLGEPAYDFQLMIYEGSVIVTGALAWVG